VARPVALLAPGSVGVSPARVEEPGRRWVGRGFGPREPPPRRIVPLMERELRIYEMSEATNPVSLARSRFFSERLLRDYAATRARRPISLKAVRHNDDDLWSFIMLPDAPSVSGSSPLFLYSSATHRRGSHVSLFPAEGDRERRAVRPAHAPSPSARGRSGGSRSGRRARRSEGSGGGSAGSRGTRNSGCASSRDSLPRRPRSIRRRERKRRRRATGGRPP
jgi:uncharacterized membrane protein YgcG